MKGIYNPKTKRYEQAGHVIQREDHFAYIGMDAEEREEMKQIERIQAEGGTYLERYAKELGVEPANLLKNMLQENGVNRFSSVKSYEEFTMLKQTLVKETGIKSYIKMVSNIIGGMY